MLDDFALEQKIAYKSFKNAVINNKVSHAYIIEANGYPMALDFAKSFVKYLLCPQHYTHNNNCKNCFQCVSIDNNDFIVHEFLSFFMYHQSIGIVMANEQKSLIGIEYHTPSSCQKRGNIYAIGNNINN